MNGINLKDGPAIPTTDGFVPMSDKKILMFALYSQNLNNMFSFPSNSALYVELKVGTSFRSPSCPTSGNE